MITRNILGIGLLAIGLFAIPVVAADKKEKPLTPVEARKQVGKEITVEMEVKAAKNALENRGEIYLDSHENFRDETNFAVVITKKGAESLKTAGIDNPSDHFKGKTIKAKGTVSEVDGVPRIEIDDAKQIELPEKK
jgi:DNA/RNA endonuclease YhcR with UshA esterase domain